MATTTTSDQDTNQGELTRPVYAVGQEIRFAVVLYGGVSLAIYMNGIAQELLRMVRATAARQTGKNTFEARLADEELRDSERVYRKLGMMLSRQARTGTDARAADNVIRTRFIVDTISGTSAGGINGIFLAKALANDQSINKLQQLWIDEGDLASLLNDAESCGDIGLPVNEPWSLLNGDRMYIKLLQALHDMDDPSKGGREKGTPLVEDLHLYVTTTDVRGLVVPLQLEDRVVLERRYKHVFHFIDGLDGDGTARHDFDQDQNRFLAYAGRCTSSFPFAFEPMHLARAHDLAPIAVGPGAQDGSPGADYRRFFEDYVRASLQADPNADPATSYLTRTFADGGYLDNKPFGHAIDALSLRADLLPSVRKLIYVEPTPEHLHPEGAGQRVDVLENSMAALFTLPTYETIREDLQRILARNRLIDRIERITNSLEKDVASFGASANPLATQQWRQMGLTDLIRRFGVAYGAYHRLKVAAATDDLAALATSAARLDPRSDEYLAIRYIVGEWRARNYVPDPVPTGANTGSRPPRTENEFLLQFGLGYRFRRLGFVRAKIDMLSCFDEQAKSLLRHTTPTPPTGVETDAFIAELLRLKALFAEIFDTLTKARDLLRDPSQSPLADAIKKSNISPADLKSILKPLTDDKRREVAKLVLAACDSAAFHEAIEQAVNRLQEPLTSVAQKAANSLRPDPSLSSGAATARGVVKTYYDQFENYDFITFPIRYSTEVGEIDKVGVIRISPEDVNNEPKALAGAQFAHFGGFLKRDWRENDILLGRLHGAERLIHALLPEDSQKADRDRFIDEAHSEILQDFVGRKDGVDVTGEVIRGIAEQAERRTNGHNQPAKGAASGRFAAFAALLRQSLSPKRLLEYYRTHYKFDPSLPVPASMRTLARTTRVVGQILAGLGLRYHKTNQPGAWVARLGGALWELVEIAVPGSLKRLVWQHWAALVALSGGLVVGASLLLRIMSPYYSGRVLAAGILLLLLPSALMTTVWLLADFLYGRGRLLRAAAMVVVLIVLLLAGMELWELATRVAKYFATPGQ
jgi:patatin-related protein